MIFPPYKVFYIESIKINCEIAFNSVEIVNQEIENHEKTNEINYNLVLGNIQNIILQAGNISKYFFPITKSEISLDRAKELREIFLIKNSNVLRNKKLRNAIEHLDEKMDVFFQTFKAGNFFPAYIGYEQENKENLNVFFRAYFLDSQRFVILNDSFKITPLMEELERIYDMIEDEIQ